MAFYGFYNVLKTQESISVEKGPINIDIYSLILSLEIIVSGLKETRFILRKPIRIFSSPKITKNVI